MSSEMNIQQDCPLFLLSKELRDKIYKMAFTSDIEETTANEPIDLTRAFSLVPSNGLMASCLRLWLETAVIYATARREFWSSNRFLIPMEVDTTTASSLGADLNALSLGTKHFQLIQRVTIRVSGPDFTLDFHFGPGSNRFVGICVVSFDFAWSASLDPSKLGLREGLEKLAVIDAVAGVLKARAGAVAARLGLGGKYVAATKKYLGYVARDRELNGNERGLMERCAAAEEHFGEVAVGESVLMKKAVLEGAVKHLGVRHNAGIRQI